eukprot:5997260-Prymnesium_polylepis.1
MLSALVSARPATAGASSKGGAAKQQGRRRAGRMSEKEEDEMMLQQSDASAGVSGAAPADGGRTRLTVQPSSITGRMRPYQLEGLNWLIRAYESGVNGVLADEMGL